MVMRVSVLAGRVIVLDLGSATMFHDRRRSHGAALDTLYLVHPQDGRWTWTPGRHGTYVVRWTSRGVTRARSVTRQPTRAA